MAGTAGAAVLGCGQVVTQETVVEHWQTAYLPVFASGRRRWCWLFPPLFAFD